jgi:hypothetical protein
MSSVGMLDSEQNNMALNLPSPVTPLETGAIASSEAICAEPAGLLIRGNLLSPVQRECCAI